MEIMMEIMAFPRLGLKTKQERTLYSSFRQDTMSLISPSDLADSQLAILHSRSSQFALAATHVPFGSSR